MDRSRDSQSAIDLNFFEIFDSQSDSLNITNHALPRGCSNLNNRHTKKQPTRFENGVVRLLLADTVVFLA